MREYAVYETGTISAALDEAGFAYVPRALGATQCKEAIARIDALPPLHWDETQGDGRFLDRYLGVFNRDAFWLQFLDRPGIIDAAEAVLGADCHVIGETAWRSHPGFRGEPLHGDYLPFTWAERALPETIRIPPFILTVHFYLTDVTPDLAPTRLVAGSHRAGRQPNAGEDTWAGAGPQLVLAAAGDALIFRSDIWHGGSDNTSADARYLLQIHYGRREMAQHFSPFTDWRFDPQILAAATKRQRRLLGDHEPGAYD